MSATELAKYDEACRALAAARSVDEVKEIRDVSIALRAYARQANNHELEANAIEIRMRATRRMDQMRQEQKATVGLNKGGGDQRSKHRVKKKPGDLPTLKEAGIDKNLAHEGRRLGALSEQEFEQKVAEARDSVTSAVTKVVKSIYLPKEAAATGEDEIDARGLVSLDQWKEMGEEERKATLIVKAALKDIPRFNQQTGPDIEWAQWSWNPITGCEHNCPYCYARDIANAKKMRLVYPYGFEPTLHPLRLLTPQTMKVPAKAKEDERYKNVFTGSMADIFGRWVPAEWIQAVLDQIRAAPDWNFLMLTKFPNRMTEFDFPKNVWAGTSIDLKARIPAAEKAFAEGQRQGEVAVSRTDAGTAKVRAS
jgi:hypothetical protein